MCIGQPMQVLSVSGPDTAMASGRDGVVRLDTRLVGAVSPGQWLLVFQDAARECLTPERAAEIEAALGLLARAMDGRLVAGEMAEPGFALPSAMSAADLARLTGTGG